MCRVSETSELKCTAKYGNANQDMEFQPDQNFVLRNTMTEQETELFASVNSFKFQIRRQIKIMKEEDAFTNQLLQYKNALLENCTSSKDAEAFSKQFKSMQKWGEAKKQKDVEATKCSEDELRILHMFPENLTPIERKDFVKAAQDSCRAYEEFNILLYEHLHNLGGADFQISLEEAKSAKETTIRNFPVFV